MYSNINMKEYLIEWNKYNLPKMVKIKLTPIWETIDFVFEIVVYFNYYVKKQNRKWKITWYIWKIRFYEKYLDPQEEAIGQQVEKVTY